MWNSPIEIVESDMELKLEDAVFKAVQSVGIRVDRDELLKALAYDRGQYEKGYADGVKDAEPNIVRCKDCKYYEILQLTKSGEDDKRYRPSVCGKGTYIVRRDEDWFCADGERKDDVEQPD